MVYFILYGCLLPHPAVVLAAHPTSPPRGGCHLIAIIGAIVTGIKRYRRERDLNHRRRLKVILGGCLIGMAGGFTGEWLTLNGWKILSAPALTAVRSICDLMSS